MHKSATKCNETQGKWCKNKHGASKIIDTLETYQWAALQSVPKKKFRGGSLLYVWFAVGISGEVDTNRFLLSVCLFFEMRVKYFP
jgi:hypothetical protein